MFEIIGLIVVFCVITFIIAMIIDDIAMGIFLAVLVFMVGFGYVEYKKEQIQKPTPCEIKK